MFLLLFFLSFSSELCHSQVVYSRMVPYDPRYVLHRPPVRRSAMEALERLRMPVTRYFPQVDSQVASAPYQPPAYPLSGYQLSSDDIYALPPQWTDEFVQQLPERSDDENDYVNYEYDGPVYRPPSYADEIYAPPEPAVEPEPSDNAYNDFMVNYFLEGSEPLDAVVQPEQFDLQRRSEVPEVRERNQGVIPLSRILEASKNSNNTEKSETTQAPSASVPSQVPPQVQMTAVPSAPEKKEIKSLVLPAPVADVQEEREEPWRSFGQKEEPLFRPLQNSQRTTWDVLTRAKNSVQKRPIPLLKKMIQNSQQKKISDPLTEELKSLKKEHGV